MNVQKIDRLLDTVFFTEKMSASDNDTSVDVGGLIQNMLDTGFSTEACIGELLDDSLGAGAKNVVFQLDSKTEKLYIIDDGCGMNKEKLRSAHTLHKRSEASDTRQGRFGIGNKHAKVHLTQHQYSTRTISKYDVGNVYYDNIVEIEIDWPNVVKTGKYENNAHPASMEASTIWGNYAINKNATGTITIITCAKSIFKELKEKLVIPGSENKPNLRKSIFYFLGVNYYDYLMSDNIVIKFKIDGKEYSVQPIDPLVWNKLPSKNKKEIELTVMKKGDDVRTYINDKNGKYYRYLTANKNAKKLTDSIGCVPIGTILVRCAFSKDWSEQSDVYNRYMNIKANSERFVFMGGVYMKRNKKIISKFNVYKPGKGDHSEQTYTIQCRYIVQFSTSLDNFFKVMVNKSKMESDLVQESILNTITKLQKEFVAEQLKVNPPPLKDDDALYEDSEDEEPEKLTIVQEIKNKVSSLIHPIVSVTNEVKPNVVENHSSKEVVPVNTIVEVPAVISEPPVNIVVNTPLKTATQEVNEIEEEDEYEDDTTPVIQPSPSLIQVRSSIRTPPKSDKEIIQLFLSIMKKHTTASLQKKISKASNLTVEGNAGLYNVLVQVDELLNKIK